MMQPIIWSAAFLFSAWAMAQKALGAIALTASCFVGVLLSVMDFRFLEIMKVILPIIVILDIFIFIVYKHTSVFNDYWIVPNK